MKCDENNNKWGPDMFCRTEAEWLQYQSHVKREATQLTNSTSPRPYIGCGVVENIAPLELATSPEPGPRIDLVDGLLPENQITILYGDGAQGKSFLALALGAAVASGNPFLGIPTLERRVLYVDWELDHEEHTRRAYKIARGVGFEKPPTGLYYYRAEKSLQELLDPLMRLIQKRSFGLLILDSFGAACGSDPEQAKFVIPILASLRSLKTSILVLDHQSKTQEGQNYRNKTIFGSVYKFNLARSVIQSHKVDCREGEISLLLRPTKYNLGALKEDIPAKLLFSDDSVRVERGNLSGDPAYQGHLTVERIILVSLETEGPAMAKELAARTDINQGTITNCLGKLKRAGKIIESGKNGHSPIYKANSTPPQSYTGGEVVENIPVIQKAVNMADKEVVS